MLLSFQFCVYISFYFESSSLLNVLTNTKPKNCAYIGYYVCTIYQLSGFAWSPQTDTCINNLFQPKYISIVSLIYALFD